MKRLLQVIILLGILISSHTSVQAKHIAGGELTYTCLHDSTYHFLFKLYRDCIYVDGSNTNFSGTLCCTNSCNTAKITASLQQIANLPNGNANCSPVSTGCTGFPTQCQSASSTLPGYQECWYEATVTLPSRCVKWSFSVYASSRNKDDNLAGGVPGAGSTSSGEMYILATLNNLIAQGNSSAYCTVEPVPFVCINSPYIYNNGGTDVNNDSLDFSLINAQDQGTECDQTTVVPIPLLPAYNLVNNPLPCNNTFALNPRTGQMGFTPNLQGKFNLTVLITEYRNRIAIGTTMRDMQVYVSALCSIPPPPFVADSINISGGHVKDGTIQNCANIPLNFCFKSKSPNQGAVLVVSDNHAQVAATATVNYTGQLTDSVIGCLSWTPSNADTGLKILTITIKDSTCAAGISIAETYSVPIFINPNIAGYGDTSICLGGSANLSAVGSPSFVWSVAPGGSPLSSLSCINCANPVATPTVTTKYIVTSTINTSAFCTGIDTVTVIVNTTPSPPHPTSNSPLCANTALNLLAGTTSSSYVWSGPAGFNSTVQNPVVANIQVPNTGWYHVFAKNGNCVSTPDSVYVSVTSTPVFPVITGNSPICSGGTINLLAQSSFNVDYSWTGPNGFHSGSQNLIIPNAGVQASGVYTVTTSYPGNSNCTSAPASYTVAVSAGIFADFHFSKDSICQYDVVAISYTKGGADSIMWNFASGVPQDTLANNPIHIQFLLPGTQTVTLTANDSGCTDVVNHPIHVYNAPPNTFSAPAVTCFGDPITVVSNNDFNQDVQFTWNFGAARVLSGSGAGPYALKYNQPGTYVVTLITQNPNCTSQPILDTLLIDPVPNASITTPNLNSICADDSVHFNGVLVAGSHYQWIQSRIFDNDTMSTTFALVRNEGNIYLNVTDMYGCKASDSLYFTPHPCCKVSFPNAFTPNGDGKNDVFRPITIGHHDIAYFRVFNRWGQLVYSSREEERGWDGTYNGTPQDAGDFYFTISYRCVDGEYFEEKGVVTLIR